MISISNELEKRLWSAADELRANSGLRASEYSTPVLGLNISETTIRRMINRGDIEAIKIGTKGKTSPWRISQSVIENYMRGVEVNEIEALFSD